MGIGNTVFYCIVSLDRRCFVTEVKHTPGCTGGMMAYKEILKMAQHLGDLRVMAATGRCVTSDEVNDAHIALVYAIEALQARVKELEAELGQYPEIQAEVMAQNKALAAKLAALEGQKPVAWAHKGPLGYAFGEKQNEAYSIPLYCAPMTMDQNFIQIPVAYQYVYPDGEWRCSYGDPINGSRPITSRALYARKDGK
jgi:hypothetical protein